jgi:hypothetical protein
MPCIPSRCYLCFGWILSQFHRELDFWRRWLRGYVRRVYLFVMPSNHPTCQTFFDLHFEPDIMVGPATLDFLTDFFGRNSVSVEGVLLILQLAHLKHFDEPLTTFVQDEQLDTPSAKLVFKKLSDSKGAAFVTSLFSWTLGSQELASDEEGWPVNDVAGLLASIAEARTDFRSHLCRLKLAFGILRKVHEVMLSLGYQVTGTEMTPLEMMSASLTGGLEQELTCLGIKTRSVATPRIRFESVFLQISWGGGRTGNCPEKSSRSCCGNCSLSSRSSQIT